MRVVRRSLLLILASLVPAAAATLERLSFEDLVTRSTGIVRGRAISSSASQIGSTIYTRTRFEVLERWKGAEGTQIEVFEPGGTVGRSSQSYSGVPRFEPGQEVVLFLWTGPSGRTQVTGLSQGVFQVVRGDGPDARVVRKPSGEILLAPGLGAPVRDEELVMSLGQLSARIRVVLEKNKR